MVVQALELAASSGLKPQVQPQDGITYAHKIEKAEAQLDWNLPAKALDRKIRAFNPFPGAAASFGGEVVKIWGAKLDAEPNESLDSAEIKTAEPGTILSSGPEGVCVQCGQGRLWLTELQRAGGKRLASADFVRGFGLPVGERWAVVK
jgi:methionyl-tRNA formyltransferase